MDIIRKYANKFTITFNDFVIDLIEAHETSNVYMKVQDLASLCILQVQKNSLE